MPSRRKLRSGGCTLELCRCNTAWLDAGWVCPVIYRSRWMDYGWQLGMLIQFGPRARLWSAPCVEEDAQMLASGDWHGNRVYEVLNVWRSPDMTAVQVMDGWVHTWSRPRGCTHGPRLLCAQRVPGYGDLLSGCIELRTEDGASCGDAVGSSGATGSGLPCIHEEPCERHDPLARES